MELVAPGQQIVSTGAFGGVCVVGGTSLAAPHVTAVASVLWQKDRSVSADFIRSLLAFTANQYGEDYEYGNGLVDLEFALSQFDAFREVYTVDADVLNEHVGAAVEAGTLDVNEKPVEEFEGVVYVEGSWWKDADNKDKVHDQFAEADSAIGKLSGTDLAIVKLGALAPDKYFSGMYRNSEWHGQELHREDIITYKSNYVYAYIYITEIAKNLKKDSSGKYLYNNFTSAISVNCADYGDCNLKEKCVARMKAEILEKFTDKGMVVETDGKPTGEKDWYTLLGNRTASVRNVSLYIYGLALHSVTDVFAHSTYLDGVQIDHEKIEISKDNTQSAADCVVYVPSRFACASLMSKYVVYRILNDDIGNVLDFYLVASSQKYDGNFKIGKLGKYIKAIDQSFYDARKNILDAMSQN